MSVFCDTNHLFLRDPGGGSASPQQMKQLGFDAIFLNVGDFPTASWDRVRAEAAQAGVVCGPWLRTMGNDGTFDEDRFYRLLAIADDWDSPLIVNSEKELDGTGDDVTSFIAGELGGRDAAISMEANPFASVAWWPLANYPILPQLFPGETGQVHDEHALRNLWQAYGIRCVVMTYGTYGGMTPDMFLRLSPYGLYTADDAGVQLPAWTPVGTVQPCHVSEGDEDVTLIGTQHGITAYVNWLRQQPNVPQRGPKYDANNVSTWPWTDRLERTLSILAADHDEDETSE